MNRPSGRSCHLCVRKRGDIRLGGKRWCVECALAAVEIQKQVRKALEGVRQ